MLTTKIERVADDTLKLDVEVAGELVDASLDATVAELAKDMRMPGSRPGKVPTGAALARIGREGAIAETVNRYLGSWYASAVEYAGIRPIADPEFDFGDLPTEAGLPYSFSATVKVAPKPKLPDLGAVTVDRPRAEDLTPFVDDVLAAILKGAGSLEPTGEGAKVGDEVLVDFSCAVDGEDVRGASAVSYEARIGDGRLLEELEAAILGQGAGADLTVPVTFPADHPMGQLAGRDAEFKLQLREVSRVQAPELTDDVARRVSEFDTGRELREDVEAGVKTRLDEQTEQAFRQNAVDAVAKAAEVTIPPQLLQQRQQELYGGLRSNLQRQGASIEAYLARTDQSENDLFAELEQQAELDVRRELTLQALAENADIAVTDDDLKAEITRHLAHGARPGEDPESTELAFARIQASGRVDALRAQLLIERTVDHLVAGVTPNDVPLDIPA